jgi:hypothetical protein
VQIRLSYYGKEHYVFNYNPHTMGKNTMCETKSLILCERTLCMQLYLSHYGKEHYVCNYVPHTMGKNAMCATTSLILWERTLCVQLGPLILWERTLCVQLRLSYYGKEHYVCNYVSHTMRKNTVCATTSLIL